MGSFEIEISDQHTPPPPPPPKQHNEPEEEEEEESPIEQVRLTVSNTDEPSLPVWTFRMWFLGLLSCVLLSFLNTFFAYRTEPLIISMISVQVATLPIGRFMAKVLPSAKFRVPGLGSAEYSLNPGPFNMKEHVLISIFANAGSGFGSGAAYAVGIVDIIKAFYHREISFFASWILVITTQVLYFVYRIGVWMGWDSEEVRGGSCGDVVAEQSRSSFSFQVIQTKSYNGVVITTLVHYTYLQ
ncbi:hypothetical protein HYC85_020359 [Camellia sinensis]|uniref:Oligopeptide transporter 4 n=1 Tax=Camellia sinensis TaxID=4442 RepID=A0A7J7GQH9_CAMSI|nr:hypothetical protein HYC85_020359 [Camellia sinensis]